MDFESEKKRILSEPTKYACLRDLKALIDGRPEPQDEDEVDEVQFRYENIENACKEFGWIVSSDTVADAVKIMRAYAALNGYIWELGTLAGWELIYEQPIPRDRRVVGRISNLVCLKLIQIPEF